MLAQVLDDMRLDIQGTLNEALNEFDGRIVAIEPQGNRRNGTLAVKRIPDEVLQAQAEAAKTDEERRAELKAMYEPLKQYAEAHNGAFPPALKALVPVPLANLDLYEDRED